MKNFEKVCENAPSPMCFLEGPDHRFTFVNQAYIELIGKHNYLNRPVKEVLPRVVEQGFIKLLDMVYSTGKAYHGEEVPIVLEKNGKREKYYLNFIYQPITDENEMIYGIFVQANDITKQVELRKDKEVLLQELHHRVGNNLAIIMGIIDMQVREITNNDCLLAFRNTRKRVGTFTKVHELIFRQHDLKNIRIHKLLEKLSKQCREYDNPEYIILVRVEELYININQAIPLGLICNEMLSWFKNRVNPANEVSIESRLTHLPEIEIRFTIHSAGNGFQEEDILWDNKFFEGRFINLLAMQLKTRIKVNRSVETTSVYIRFIKDAISGTSASYIP